MTRRSPIFLVGFMLSGKTTVGRILARELGRGFIDTDERVVATAGRSIEQIVEDAGETELRKLEAAVFGSIDVGAGEVVATGGGAFSSWELRRGMKARGITVWLDIPLSVARARRAGHPAPRPLWQDGDPVAFRAFYDRRRAIYALAGHRIEAGGTPEEVARAVLDRL